MGLGAEFARVLAADGYDLILTARSADRLANVQKEVENLHGARTRVVVADLADRDAPEVIHHEAWRAFREGKIGASPDGTIDVLVNNAGFGMYGMFHRSDLKTELDMVQVNVTSLMHLTKLFLPAMVSRGSGRILNVASTAAFQPGPLQPVYYATKAFVLSFSEAIANELKGTGVTVTALCPGPTPTEFQARANVGNVRGLRLMMRVSPEAVVRAGCEGMQRGKPVVIPGTLNNLHVFLLRFAPRGLVTAVVRKVQSRPQA
jgi:hypothetical protein